MKTLNKFPKSPGLLKIIGPSFILLGMGLGSGELILWPYLSSQWGLGIVWGALVGITFQFIINTEIERYSLARGESIFVGMSRRFGRIMPIWFIASTIIPWMWPGIISGSSEIISHIFSIDNSKFLSIFLLILIGLVLTLGPVVYKTLEFFQKYLILLGVPFIILLTLYLSGSDDYTSLFKGIAGLGDGYFLLPAGISIATFLGALAFSGAGGNLNLAQSFYIKEKGYGMGKYAGRITSLLTGKKEDIDIQGSKFVINPQNLNRFKKWWRIINIEHLLIFWLTGLVTMLVLALLAHVTLKNSDVGSGISFILMQSTVISSRTTSFLGIGFLVISSLMLFSTQLSVMDATSRILSENLVILSPEKYPSKNIPGYYYFFLWVQIALGIIIFLFGITEPIKLITISACLNAFSMFVYSLLVLIVNRKLLEVEIRPGAFKTFLVLLGFLFYGFFSVYVIYGYLS